MLNQQYLITKSLCKQTRLENNSIIMIMIVIIQIKIIYTIEGLNYDDVAIYANILANIYLTVI